MMAAEMELCWPTLRQVGFLDLVRIAATNGFSALTVSCDICRRSGLGLTDLRRSLDEAGIRVTYLDGLPGALPGTPEIAGWSQQEVFDLASALGAERLNVAHFGGDPATPVPVLGEALARAAERAALSGLTVMVEFIPGTGVPDLQSAVDLVKAAGVPGLGILLDSWHLYRSGGSPALLIGEAVQLVAAIQLADRRRSQDDDPYVPMTGRLLPGEGELPLAAMVTAVLAVHPELPVGIEIFNEELLTMDPDEAARRAATSLRRTLDLVANRTVT
jgi:sugar phosphate isomerase/epimerase